MGCARNRSAIGRPPTKRPPSGGRAVCFMCGAGAGTELSCKRPALGAQAQFQLWIFSYTILVALTNYMLSRVMLAGCRRIFWGLSSPGIAVRKTASLRSPMSRKSDLSDLRINDCGTRASPSSDAIHAFAVADAAKTWMPGTRPGMTECVSI